MKGSMRILGIDPGLRVTGFGIIDMQGGTAHYVGSGSIRTGERTLPQRLAVIADGIKEVVEHYRPQVSAIEQVFVNVNPQSTLLLGQARGAAMLTLVQSQLEVYEYTALQVKQSVVGNGHADKKQVQSMVKRLLSLAGDPQADAADALACALCHAHHSSGLMGKFTRAGMTQRAGRLR